MSERHLVFAYGSNLDLEDLHRWLEQRGYPAMSPHRAEAAQLEGWQLAFNYRSPTRMGGAANVIPRPSAHVPGALLDVDTPLLAALDRKEGHPDRYRRQRLPIVRPGGATEEAWVYVVTPAWEQPASVPPRRAYRDIMVRGAQRLGLPEGHVRHLAALETLD